MRRSPTTPTPIDHLLTTVGLARLFRVSRVTVNNWRRSGCPCVLIPGDSRDVPRYDLGAVVAWRDAKRRPVPSWVKSRLARLTGKASPSSGPRASGRPGR